MKESPPRLEEVPNRLEERVAAIALLNDPVRRALYEFVAASDGPVSRDQAAESADVQRTLAAFHLDKLATAGLLDVEFRRLNGRSGPGAGRPAKLYRRGTQGVDVSLPQRQYDLAAHLLAAAVDEAADKPANIRKVLHRAAFEFGRQLGEEAESRAGSRPSAAKRREAALQVLADNGFEPRVVGRDVLLANCPFHSLARRFTNLVCGMNLRLMEGFRSSIQLADTTFQPRLQPEDDFCCVRFGPTSR